MRPSVAQAPLYGPRLAEALAFVANAFASRIRKGSGVPYVTHLLQVMVHVGEADGSEDQLLAALLHDYLEDIEGSRYEDLSSRFGEHVADLVLRLSDTTTRPKPPWKERKQRYVDVLRAENAELKLVSAADKLHNATTLVRDIEEIGVEAFDSFNASMDETLWYYRAALEALEDGYSHRLVDELRVAVKRMHALAGMGSKFAL